MAKRYPGAHKCSEHKGLLVRHNRGARGRARMAARERGRLLHEAARLQELQAARERGEKRPGVFDIMRLSANDSKLCAHCRIAPCVHYVRVDKHGINNGHWWSYYNLCDYCTDLVHA